MISVNGTVDETGSPVHAPRRVGAPVVLSAEAARQLRHWPVAVKALDRRLLVIRFPALLSPPKDEIAPGVRLSEVVRPEDGKWHGRKQKEKVRTKYQVPGTKYQVPRHESMPRGAGQMIFQHVEILVGESVRAWWARSLCAYHLVRKYVLEKDRTGDMHRCLVKVDKLYRYDTRAIHAAPCNSSMCASYLG